MQLFYRTTCIASLTVLAMVFFSVAYAQNAEETNTIDEALSAEEAFLDEAAIDIEIPEPANTVSCFDYYTFGSVQANLSAPVTGTVSGVPITFSGTLENSNPYPIVDGTLYVKIFKSRGSENDGNGPDVVDQFFVKDDVVIPANGSIPISFSWDVPSYARTGEYQLATFFTTSRKFNLLGLSFTDDVIGNTVPFRVTGEQRGGVAFDKGEVTVNDEPYYFAAFPPRTDAASPVEVEALVRNTTNASQTAVVLWTVSQWDAQQRENVVQEETRQVTIPAGGSASVSTIVRDTKYPVYLVTGTLQWKDTKSVIGVRFVRTGLDRTRINFPGVMSFPLVEGQENTLFSCLHNSGESGIVEGGRLELTLKDVLGNTIHEHIYSGGVTGAMMGVASLFTPKETYDYFTLSARLYKDDQLVDEANLIYDCNTINPALCNPKPSWDMWASLQAIGVILFALFSLIIVIWMYRRISRRTRPNTTQLPPL